MVKVRRNIASRLEQGEDGRGWLEVLHGDEIDFFDSVRPRTHISPALALRDIGKWTSIEFQALRHEGTVKIRKKPVATI